MSGASAPTANTPATAPATRTAAGSHTRSTSATPAAAARSTTAPTASTWSVPYSGTSQNAVAKVPAMLPAVESENSRPAVRPSRSSERAARRTAIGETEARTTLIGPNRATAATSGSSRGPGSHETTRSSTHWSTSGIASTSSAPSAIALTRRYGDGQRSATAPPIAYPSARPVSTTPISAPQT